MTTPWRWDSVRGHCRRYCALGGSWPRASAAASPEDGRRPAPGSERGRATAGAVRFGAGVAPCRAASRGWAADRRGPPRPRRAGAVPARGVEQGYLSRQDLGTWLTLPVVDHARRRLARQRGRDGRARAVPRDEGPTRSDPRCCSRRSTAPASAPPPPPPPPPPLPPPRPTLDAANGRTLRRACVDRARLGAGLGVRGGGPGGYERGREAAWAEARP